MQRLVLDLIAGIASEDEAARDRAADEVTDIHRELDEADVEVVAGVFSSPRGSPARGEHPDGKSR